MAMEIGMLILTAMLGINFCVAHGGNAEALIRPNAISSSPFTSESSGMALALGAMALRRRRNSKMGAESERNWSLLAACAGGIGAWNWDAESDTAAFSPEWSEMLGYRAGKFPPHFTKWKDLLHPQDALLFEDHLQACRAGHKDKFSIECRCRHMNGQYVFFLMRGVVVRDELGRVGGCCGTAFDISNYKASERRAKRLSITSKMLSGVMEAVLHAEDEESLVKDVIQALMESECYTSVYLDLLGHEGGMRPYAAASKYLDIKHDDALHHLGARVIQTGEMVSEHEEIANQEEDEELTKLCRVALPLVSGEMVMGVLGVAAIQSEPFDREEVKMLLELSGDLAHGVHALRLAAVRRKQEENLRKLSWVVEQSPALIVITDNMGRIEYINHKFSEVSGFCLDDIAGKFPRDLKSDVVPLDDYEQCWACDVGKKDWRGLLHCRRKDGGFYWALSMVSPIRNLSGEVANFVEIAEDVTERKQVEQQLAQAQKMEGLGNLAGGIAHDFNNMLLPILSLTKMTLAELPADGRAHLRLTKVMEAAERARELISKIMLFSRRSGEVVHPTYMYEVVAETLSLLHSTIPSTINLRENISVMPLPVLADPTLIETVILNLASNAVHAMEGRVGDLEIALQPMVVDEAIARDLSLPRAGGYARLTVADTGCGMDESVMTRIFDPFFTTKVVGQGTGLGLSSVFGIVTKCGGEIRVKSSKGVGSTFDVFLPLIEDSAMSVESGHA
ncbi:MAG: PAS domain-containing protein [Rhodospirillales bacterium]|nr:PAS domain-containing protein [Rhodospirillales bacterium]